jgi:hypothetical protein
MIAIKRMLGTAIGFVMVLVFTGAIAALVLSLALPNKAILKDAIEDLRCLAGYPSAGSTCAQDQIRQADAATAAANRQRAAAEAARQAAEDALVSGDLEFAQGPELKYGVSLVVGTIYQDAVTQSGLVRSFCWAIVDSGGLDPRVGVATRDATGAVTVLDLSDADLALLELDASEVSAALASCPWPGGTT